MKPRCEWCGRFARRSDLWPGVVECARCERVSGVPTGMRGGSYPARTDSESYRRDMEEAGRGRLIR